MPQKVQTFMATYQNRSILWSLLFQSWLLYPAVDRMNPSTLFNPMSRESFSHEIKGCKNKHTEAHTGFLIPETISWIISGVFCVRLSGRIRPLFTEVIVP